MQPDILERIVADPIFHELVKSRKRVSYVLSVAVIAIYFGFVTVVAFWPEVLTTLLEPGVATTIGMPVALVTLIIMVMCTGYYVRVANMRFDQLTVRILRNLDQ